MGVLALITPQAGPFCEVKAYLALRMLMLKLVGLTESGKSVGSPVSIRGGSVRADVHYKRKI